MDTIQSPEERKHTSGKHPSYWIDSIPQQRQFTPLHENLETDVVIVGAGLAGITTAYCLLQTGKSVVIIEDGFVGSGETGRTTAHIATEPDEGYDTLEQNFGKENAKLIADSYKAALKFIEDTCKKENIDCEFEKLTGYLFLHYSDDEQSLDDEMAAAKRAGIEVSDLDMVPGIIQDIGRCLRFPNQAQFHPMKYLLGLCKAIVEKGGKIYTETHAETINHEGIITDKGIQVKAKHVVIATNTPVNNKIIMHIKQFPFRTYVIGALVKKDLLPRALWWDTGDYNINKHFPPYHYARLTEYNDLFDLLIIGGEDHPVGDTHQEDIPEEDRYALIEDWARRHFPIEAVIYRWSGQIMEPMDGLAYIGHNPWDKNNVYIITGDSGNGMTHCTIGGILITDLINEKENPWKKIYQPSRFKISQSGHMFKELMQGMLASVKKNKISPTAKKLSEIHPNEGKIIEIGGQHYGVFRDTTNHLHFVSLECTHLRCTVSWNNDEKSWDCPCHGSRFTYDGKVINGPANEDLLRYSEESMRHEGTQQ
jgi:glycine/D-amino acid oxidase-like deaminating enzyme/nitrite reductase/ring-hydroxylating ferredoxin subunit